MCANQLISSHRFVDEKNRSKKIETVREDADSALRLLQYTDAYSLMEEFGGRMP